LVDYRPGGHRYALCRGAAGAAFLFPARYLTGAKLSRHDSEKPAGESARWRLSCAGRSAPAHGRLL
jgi:hypothetical protein